MNEFPIEWMNKIKNMFTCSNKPRIIFFGGEPLVKLDLIKRIVEEYNNDFQFQVVTNGMVNFHDFMDDVYEKYKTNFDVQVSWDGNDITRKMVNGTLSNDTVYNSILTELKKNRIVEGRCVINDNSVKVLHNTYFIFKNLYNDYNFGGDFTIAHQLSFEKDFCLNLKNQLILIFSDIKKDLIKSKDKNIFIPRFLLKCITNVIQKKPVVSCDIGTHIVIKPNGDVYPCTILSQQDNRFKMGNINNNIDTNIIDDLRYNSKCLKKCEYKSLCDGGCRYERIKSFSDWKNNICSHTCEIYSVIYDVIISFLNELSNEEKTNLYQIIYEYNLWKIDYDNGIESNNQVKHNGF